MLCPHCKQWEIAGSDIYCAWCRNKLVDFTIAFNRNHLCVKDLIDDLALTFTHTGSVGNIRIERIESSQPWLIPHPERLADLIGTVGRNVIVPFDIDLPALSDDYHEAQVVVTSNVGRREVVLEIVPVPKFQINTGGEHTVLLDNLPEEITSGYLAVTRGIVTVKSIETNVPEWATIELAESDKLPCQLDQRDNNRLEFDFRFNEGYLLDEIRRSDTALPAEYKGTLSIKLAESDEPRKEIFRVRCFLPPALQIPEAAEGRIRLEVFAGKHGEFNLTLQNGERDEMGHADLQIREIKIDVPWLVPSGEITYPLTIASGHYHGLTLRASTTDIGEGIHPARVAFVTNTPGDTREKSIPLDLDIKRMSDFDGLLAIDFGTTNTTCCAIPKKEGVLSLVPIGSLGEGKQTTVSSTILYQDLFDDNVKDYIIGNAAYEISFHPSAAHSAVRQVKRLLGKSDPIEITFHKDPTKHASYLPRQVATDIIQRVLDRAEEDLKGRIIKCIISHPSRFSLGQLEDLKEAVASCGIAKANIKTVHEPIGAALDFIQLADIREKYPEYYLIVFDFGGGTTDITLMHVKNQYQAKRELTRITMEVLGTSGDRWFGGEDVTDIVMNLVRERCEQMLKDRNPEALNVVVPLEAESFTAQQSKRLARDNRNRLRSWAEAAKIAIATYGDEHQTSLGGNAFIDEINIRSRLPESFQLAVIVDNEVRLTETFYHEEIVPRQEEINAQVKPKLESIARMMQGLAENNNVTSPDIILLSGKSSALPVVSQVMAQHFPESHLHRPTDSKECVVRGACQLISEDPIEGLELKFVGAKTAMTSRLGMRVRDPHSQQPKFREVIAAGRPVGHDGLREPVLGIGLNRGNDLIVLENTGLEDWIYQDGKSNRNITVLKVSHLDAKLAEWEQKHDVSISDADLEDATIELFVSPNLAVKLLVTVPGIDETFEFPAEWGGG